MKTQRSNCWSDESSCVKCETEQEGNCRLLCILVRLEASCLLFAGTGAAELQVSWTFAPSASSSPVCPVSLCLSLSQAICCLQSSGIDLQLCAGDHMLIYSVSDKHSSALPRICPTDSLCPSLFSQWNQCHPPSLPL